ncbi:hypothetical protein C8R43DRAFT_181400 [Mycena crocata]|nr:hypothetical protein C8R43DRAFT_181400 [Mycena crocata]
MHPLHVPELIDICIGFIDPSSPDLQACSLVSHAWVYAAQARLFNEIYILSAECGEASWMRLKDILQTSPHLIPHIRRLEVCSHSLPIALLTALCNFPFTRLESACLYFEGPVSLEVSIAARHLLSLPTLRCIGIHCHGEWQATALLQMCSRLAAGIRHLTLITENEFMAPFSPIVIAPRDSIKPTLHSLQLVSVLTPGWLVQEQFPFDLSHLKVLSISVIGPSPWQHVVPSLLRTVEVLDLIIPPPSQNINLSLFANLRLFHLSATPETIQFDTLRTISPANRIRKIVINCSSLDERGCAELDSVLPNLPLHESTIIVLTMNAENYGHSLNRLPKSSQKMTIRRADPNPDSDWFQSFTANL